VVDAPDLDIGVIDTRMGDLTGMTAAFVVPGERPALVETGPGRSVGHVLAGLRALGIGRRDLAWIVLTHVHLDHAGAAGELVGHFPGAQVAVHPAGARHLADPSRLVASAERVHGPLMRSVYGPMAAVPADRIHPVEHGERLDLGGRSLSCWHTPGHAAHHLAVLDEDTGTLLPGDAIGVQVAGMRTLRPATPPPDFDLDTALASLEVMRTLEPRRLLLTHFGPFDDAPGRLDEAERRLRAWCAVARAALTGGDGATRGDGTDDAYRVERALLDAFADEEGLARTDPLRFTVFGGYTANAAGLLRWASRAGAPS
jgi:glyoxylase-like metal-dependent hydrolase (beta-lactamase superfamily II)